VFVYLVGAGVLWVRLWREGLPTDAVIAVLPRELVVAVGLRSIVVPAVILAPIAALVLWRATKIQPSNLRDFWEGLGGVGGAVRVLASLVAGVTVVASWLVGGPLIVVGWIVGIIVVTMTSAVIGITLRNRLSTIPGVALTALAVSSAAALARVVVELEDPRLASAEVCVVDGGDAYDGVLIGETDQAVYLGQPPSDRVVAVPRDRIGELWIGTDSATCSVPLPDAPGVQREP
jgi:hypothetical protein